ncbi:uncharacterized protein DUF1992 [Tamaricihabitans halophyticus]|uniref:Uncharacterized protein DUF1992 n=1 Tax=Tamaricihabitans halophyticus TaxID=1262583 RepID=A0A4R2QMU4_9PSEU|nr:DUF1992 domain-containing protein [Tamaricihabitans halophyticus]TCP50893.1 uncharacterized protein DUF1992 [Tamaricihabitans halophyticus]
MTERKPPGVDFESWVERQIREAQERGEFDNLPGAGQPLPDTGRPLEEMWWVKQKLRDEDLAYLPPTLALRKEAELALTAARQASTESEVRRILADINDRIRTAIRIPPAGPPLNMAPYDVDEIVAEWRAG